MNFSFKKHIIFIVSLLSIGVFVAGCSSQSAKSKKNSTNKQIVLKNKPIKDLNAVSKKSYVLSAKSSGKSVASLSDVKWKKQAGEYVLAFPDAKHMVVERIADGKFHYGREYELVEAKKGYLNFKQVAYLVSADSYKRSSKASQKKFSLQSGALPGLQSTEKVYRSTSYQIDKTILKYKLFTLKKKLIRDSSTNSTKQSLLQYSIQK